jgi:hypothetical protein
VKLDMIILANYAEDHGGLLTLVGAGWDTVNVRAPLEGGPPNVIAFVQGTLVVRMLFHQTELERNHHCEITVIDEDGQQIAKVENDLTVHRLPDSPAAWDQGVNIVVPLTGMPLPREGHYVINVNVDGHFLGERPFRVVKWY